jgi:hypothetical protein
MNKFNVTSRTLVVIRQSKHLEPLSRRRERGRGEGRRALTALNKPSLLAISTTPSLRVPPILPAGEGSKRREKIWVTISFRTRLPTTTSDAAPCHLPARTITLNPDQEA